MPCSSRRRLTGSRYDCLARLGLKLQKASVEITGNEGEGRAVSNYVNLKVKSRINNFTASISCLVMKKIGDELPARGIRKIDVKIPNGIELADPQFDKPRPIDLLIGAGLYYELECSGMIRLQDDQPFFKKTLLGWVVTGKMQLPPF